jgi:hypothetical protein
MSEPVLAYFYLHFGPWHNVYLFHFLVLSRIVCASFSVGRLGFSSDSLELFVFLYLKNQSEQQNSRPPPKRGV